MLSANKNGEKTLSQTPKTLQFQNEYIKNHKCYKIYIRF